MYTGFVVLGILSIAMFIWAYYRRLEDDFPSDDDRPEGGIPTWDDTYPVDLPPSAMPRRHPSGDATEEPSSLVIHS